MLAALNSHGRNLRVLRPESPQELEALLTEIVAGTEWGCTWVEAIRDRDADSGAWTQAWLGLLLRANERRELLRSRLQGGLVFVAHPDVKADFRAAAPDLWSVRTLVADLPPTQGLGGVEDARELVLVFQAGDQADSELLDEDLRRATLLESEPPEQRARGLVRLAGRLRAAGRYQEGLTSTQKAVDLYRDLATTSPDAFLPELAKVLHNLAAFQRTLGQREEALVAARESVEIWRMMASANPGAFERELAMSLTNFGSVLSESGRPAEALSVTQEAVVIARELTNSDSEAIPDLALALDNLGSQLSLLGRSGEAIRATEKALEHYRQLVKSRPDAFVPDLARTLVNLGMRLWSLGRLEEARAATQEGLEYYRKLAAVNPNLFLPEVAGSLGALGSIQRERGDLQASFSAFGEGVRILEPFARAVSAAFGHRFQLLINGLETTCKEGGLTPPSDLQHLLDASGPKPP
ncbi:MAG: tetratricopeptide repeat protein [Enhygromyxa sp.]